VEGAGLQQHAPDREGVLGVRRETLRQQPRHLSVCV
jgi:hypothetical protein